MSSRPVALVRAVLMGALALSPAACVPSYRMTPAPAYERGCPTQADGAISWYFPEPAGDNRRLEEWCVTVGETVSRPNPSADFGSAGSLDSLAVLVWNSNVGGGDLAAFLREELGLQCDGASSELRPGAPHAALLVQEAFRRSEEIPDAPPQWAIPAAVHEEARDGPRIDTPAMADRCGLSLLYVPSARNGSEPLEGLREDKGVAILSTLSLRDPIAIELPYEAARRVAAGATLSGPDGRSLRLISAHFISTPAPWRVLTTGNASRWRQAMALLDAVRQIDAELGEAATVLAGDLNTWSNRETTLRHLREAFPDSPPPVDEGTRGPFPTDHLFFRRIDAPGSPAIVDDSYSRISSRYGSDHNPLAVTFRFRSPD